MMRSCILVFVTLVGFTMAVPLMEKIHLLDTVDSVEGAKLAAHVQAAETVDLVEGAEPAASVVSYYDPYYNTLSGESKVSVEDAEQAARVQAAMTVDLVEGAETVDLVEGAEPAVLVEGGKLGGCKGTAECHDCCP
mmetsp:Transcript_5393/g.7510  ORF Transcript_5393/g.7510 Transcript_5393/m.7510 type:complete len:136 (-) Transcript_5393:50-457(-)